MEVESEVLERDESFAFVDIGECGQEEEDDQVAEQAPEQLAAPVKTNKREQR